MKYLPLIWSGIRRRPVRTALVFLQVGVAFALFGVLQGMKTGIDEAISKVQADVLFVAPAVFGGPRLPMAYINQLRSIPGVKSVTYADAIGGTYQKPTQSLGVLTIDPDKIWLTLVPSILTMRPRDLQALRNTRSGALVTADIARKYGWHVGDEIAIKSRTQQSSGSRTWFFNIVGNVRDHEPGEGGLIVGNYSYLNEARAFNKDTVRNFYVVVSDPKQAAAVSEVIDRTFANSPVGTRTISLREIAEQEMQSIGNVSFAIRWIISAVLVALAFAISTMTMQTIRERTFELAILKALGFGNRMVFMLLAVESLVVWIAAALAGLALAWIAFPLAGKYVPGLSMPSAVVEVGIGGAVVLALISVTVPGHRAARLKVAEALAGR
ncbi:MAG: ABC transporter permease [Steroidobacteraceae bacterium]